MNKLCKKNSVECVITKKRKKVFVITGLIVTFGFFNSSTCRKMSSVEQILMNEIESGRTPSAQYYFFDQDSIIKSLQFGFSNIEKKKETNINTTYNAFSVTKTFTALAVLQLAEQNKINIDEPVYSYLSGFPYGKDITIRHVLSHSSGIPNPVPLSWIHLDSEHKTFDRDTFFKLVFTINKKVKSGLNEKFAYSNLGYVILGQLIENVSGKKYETYIEENIIRKLSLKNSDLSFEIYDNDKHATGYHKRQSLSGLFLSIFIDESKFMNKTEGKWRSFNNFHVNGASYGGLIGKPIAFVKYIQEILNDNNKLISDEYKKLLFRENITNKGDSTGMCLSWFSGQLNGEKYFAHAGGGGGYYCEIRLYPELKLGSVIFFNRSGMSDERFLDKLDIVCLKEQNR